MTKEEIDWEKLDDGMFVVRLLPVIFNTKTKKVLICRKENFPYYEGLTWSFPGVLALPKDELEDVLKEGVLEQTNCKVESLGTIFAKTYPENRKVISIYYLCEIIEGEEKAGGEAKELKWVKPEDIEKHFTTSFHPKLREYIMNLK